MHTGLEIEKNATKKPSPPQINYKEQAYFIDDFSLTTSLDFSR